MRNLYLIFLACFFICSTLAYASNGFRIVGLGQYPQHTICTHMHCLPSYTAQLKQVFQNYVRQPPLPQPFGGVLAYVCNAVGFVCPSLQALLGSLDIPVECFFSLLAEKITLECGSVVWHVEAWVWQHRAGSEVPRCLLFVISYSPHLATPHVLGGINLPFPKCVMNRNMVCNLLHLAKCALLYPHWTIRTWSLTLAEWCLLYRRAPICSSSYSGKGS